MLHPLKRYSSHVLFGAVRVTICKGVDYPAIWEFEDETDFKTGEFISPRIITQKGGKWVSVRALERDFVDPQIRGITFELEWPLRSGMRQTFPEVDKASWFRIAEEREKILEVQVKLLDRPGALPVMSLLKWRQGKGGLWPIPTNRGRIRAVLPRFQAYSPLART